jgi:folate-binding protein YgfZ
VTQTYTILEDRGLIAVGGEEARDFLQGLISNDVAKAGAGHAIYAALLTPQGKFLHDFFLIEHGGRLLLDCEGARAADLLKRLTFYRLRAKVTLDDVSSDHVVAAIFGDGAFAAAGLTSEAGAAVPFADGIAFVDPRLAAVGARAILPRASAREKLEAAGFRPADTADYDRLRLANGLPDGSRDLVVEKSILLESGFEELNGVDFEKGCFIGQELTARTKYRALIRKRLMRVDVDGPLPAPGTPIMHGEKEAGEMRSGRDGTGIALVRLEQLEQAEAEGETLTAGDSRIKPVKPAWAAF